MPVCVRTGIYKMASSSSSSQLIYIIHGFPLHVKINPYIYIFFPLSLSSPLCYTRSRPVLSSTHTHTHACAVRPSSSPARKGSPSHSLYLPLFSPYLYTNARVECNELRRVRACVVVVWQSPVVPT